jgi:hypothetical protein
MNPAQARHVRLREMFGDLKGRPVIGPAWGKLERAIVAAYDMYAAVLCDEVHKYALAQAGPFAGDAGVVRMLEMRVVQALSTTTYGISGGTDYAALLRDPAMQWVAVVTALGARFPALSSPAVDATGEALEGLRAAVINRVRTPARTPYAVPARWLFPELPSDAPDVELAESEWALIEPYEPLLRVLFVDIQ